MRSLLGLAMALLFVNGCADGTSSSADGPRDSGSRADAARPDANVADGPGPTPDDGGPRPSAIDASATPNRVTCGAQSCDTTTQHCCVTTMMPACTTTCSGMVDLACDGPEDCASNQVCCATPSMSGVRSACAQDCTMMQIQLCHNASQCPSKRPVCCGPMGATTGGCSPSGACN